MESEAFLKIKVHYVLRKSNNTFCLLYSSVVHYNTQHTRSIQYTPAVVLWWKSVPGKRGFFDNPTFFIKKNIFF